MHFMRRDYIKAESVDINPVIKELALTYILCYCKSCTSVGTTLDPCGGSTRPGCKSPGFEARRALDVYEPADGYGCGLWQVVARRSAVWRTEGAGPLLDPKLLDRFSKFKTAFDSLA